MAASARWFRGRPWAGRVRRALPAVSVLWAAGPAGAQTCADTGALIHVGFDALSGTATKDANCACTSNCTVGFRCYPPVLGGAFYALLPAGCNPKTQGCTVRATVFTDFPGNSQSLQAIGGGALVDWFNSSFSNVGSCGRVGAEIYCDQDNAWIQLGGSRDAHRRDGSAPNQNAR